MQKRVQISAILKQTVVDVWHISQGFTLIRVTASASSSYMVAVREMGTTSKQSRIAKARVDENMNYNESYGQQDPFFITKTPP